MTSLSEVYERGTRGPSLRRLYAGAGTFLAGVLLTVGAIVVAASDLALGTLTLGQAREVGGVLGGVGVPLVMLGVLAVLPASHRTRVAAIGGAAVSFVGVLMFVVAYPCRWSGATCGAGLTELTFPTVFIYFAGAVTTFGCLFVGVANFKTRNDPGGTARLDVVKKGETRVVEVERGGGLGGIGLFGGMPDGEVETQTNQPATADGASATGGDVGTGGVTRVGSGGTTRGASGTNGTPTATSTSGTSTTGAATTRTTTAGTSSARSSASASGSSSGGSAAASDGGATTRTVRSVRDDDSEVYTEEPRPVGDPYCGNCEYFEYVRTEAGIQPYCGFHDGLMDDMTACDDWSGRQG